MNSTITFKLESPFFTAFLLAWGVIFAVGINQILNELSQNDETPPLRIEFSPQISEPHYERQDYRGPV
ncbi:hypothetical protein [Hyphomicrobium sp. DY-1]|uniref:hypothetical protein n=1 Tax=Hyphomicrobium sp. DY-1 TaxID=3075650 RepID=UPI0039C1F82A